MYCAICGSALVGPANSCSSCGVKAPVSGQANTQAGRLAPNPVSSSTVPSTAPGVVPPAKGVDMPASGFWRRLGQALALEIQGEAMVNAMQVRSGDHFWSGTTASSNDKGQSGYVDAGGTVTTADGDER